LINNAGRLLDRPGYRQPKIDCEQSAHSIRLPVSNQLIDGGWQEWREELREAREEGWFVNGANAFPAREWNDKTFGLGKPGQGEPDQVGFIDTQLSFQLLENAILRGT
jgi:hypothetical protein